MRSQRQQDVAHLYLPVIKSNFPSLSYFKRALTSVLTDLQSHTDDISCEQSRQSQLRFFNAIRSQTLQAALSGTWLQGLLPEV